MSGRSIAREKVVAQCKWKTGRPSYKKAVTYVPLLQTNKDVTAPFKFNTANANEELTERAHLPNIKEYAQCAARVSNVTTMLSYYEESVQSLNSSGSGRKSIDEKDRIESIEGRIAKLKAHEDALKQLVERLVRIGPDASGYVQY